MILSVFQPIVMLRLQRLWILSFTKKTILTFRLIMPMPKTNYSALEIGLLLQDILDMQQAMDWKPCQGHQKLNTPGHQNYLKDLQDSMQDFGFKRQKYSILIEILNKKSIFEQINNKTIHYVYLEEKTFTPFISRSYRV